MPTISFEDFKEIYEKYGKTPGQLKSPKNPLNEKQLKTRYDKYIKTQQKNKDKLNDISDEMWESVKRIVYERDQNKCRLLPLCPTEYYPEWLGPLDPCHIFRKSSYPHLKYEPDNVVLLHRVFHQRLDRYEHPFTGKSIGFNEIYKWWETIVGKKCLENLKEKVYYR